MPRIPTLFAERQVGYSRGLPAPPPEVYGAGVGQALQEQSQVFERIQAGSDASEIAKLDGQGTEQLKGALTEAKAFNDPEQYKAYLDDKIPAIHEATLGQATNSLTRRALEAKLTNNRIAAESAAKFGYFEKKKDLGEANYVIAKDTIEKQIIDGTLPPEEGFNLIDKLIGNMTASGYMKPSDAAKDMLKSKDRVQGDMLALEARRNPVDFGDKVDQGQFKGSDPVHVQRALDIAEKERNRRDAQLKAKLAEDSKNVSNMLYEGARNHELDPDRVKEYGRLYAWPDDKTNEILRINQGLKEDSPYKEGLIADAMESVIKVQPTMGDVDKAAQRLQSLAGRGQISADSTEFKSAMNRLRGLKDSLTFRGTMQGIQQQRQANQLFTQDRQRAANMYDALKPQADTEERKKELNTIYRQLDALRNDPGGRTKYLGDVEKQIMDKKKSRDSWEPGVQGLRGFGTK